MKNLSQKTTDVSYFDNRIFLAQEDIKKFINDSFLNSPNYIQTLESLKAAESGGFDQADLSTLYVTFQNDERYKTTRYKGWQNIFRLMAYCLEKSARKVPKDLAIIDFLAGSGTLSKRLKTLWKETQKLPTVLGMDVAEKMCELARKNNEVVFWGSHNGHCFKNNIADLVVAAYGTHHVSTQERSAFVNSAYHVLKEGGICFIHDYIEGSSGARWHSEIIHKYRSCGHDFDHFTEESISSLLSQDFLSSEIEYIYEPFRLVGKKGQNAHSLKKEFFAYLISFFNLSKLLPPSISFEQIFNYDNESYWKDVEAILTPYFDISPVEIGKVNAFEKKVNRYENFLHPVEVPIVKSLTIFPLDEEKLCLVAPRVSIVGIGYKGAKKHG